MANSIAPWKSECLQMTGEQKLEFVRDQCNDMWDRGETTSIKCPYCLETLPKDKPACCSTLLRATNVIVEARRNVDRLMRMIEQRESRIVQ